ncbi:hypothetical protein ABTX81_06310 [Kitasatospora sp. NPDC097605]|uniref:hypothetical protein n=1 Tax=Kitasatospora sp. NPDC097605 TaxID=3157226 RepID=UPI003330A1A5
MNAWIDLDALWRILVVGLLAGAGLPALFALGLRALNPPARVGEAMTARPTSRTGYALAGLCFGVVLAAIGWGIHVIVGHR